MRTVSLAVLVVSALFGARLQQLGVFQAHPERSVEREWQCRVHHGVENSEDIILAAGGEYALISSFDTVGVLEQGHLTKEGHVFLWRVEGEEEPQPLKLVDYTGSMFSPHGMSLSEPNVLFVIDHGYDSSNQTVVSFRVDFEARELRQTNAVSSPMFTSLNAVHGIDASECGIDFYVTNDHRMSPFRNRPLNLLEDVVGYKGSNVLYYRDAGDGMPAEIRVVVSSIAGAVGLELDKRARYIYVSDVLNASIGVYDSAAGFELNRVISLDSHPDNLHFGLDGRLWVGAHPSVIAVARHLMSGTLAPSHVLTIDVDHGDRIRHEYLSLAGQPVSGTSVGALTKSGTLLLGTMRDKLASCV